MNRCGGMVELSACKQARGGGWLREHFCGPSGPGAPWLSLCWEYWLWREPRVPSQKPAALWQNCSSVCWGKLTLHVPLFSNGSKVIQDLPDCQLPPWNRKSILNKSSRTLRLRAHLQCSGYMVTGHLIGVTEIAQRETPRKSHVGNGQIWVLHMISSLSLFKNIFLDTEARFPWWPDISLSVSISLSIFFFSRILSSFFLFLLKNKIKYDN